VKTVRGECEARPDGTNIVTLTVEETQVTRMPVDGRFRHFTRVGFGMEADRPDSRVDFDNLVVRAL
jgi:hypothetical protein